MNPISEPHRPRTVIGRDGQTAIAPEAPGVVEPAADPRRWRALWVVLIAAFMDILDTTVVLLALPLVRESMGASDAQLQWTVAGYQLAFASLLITGGRLGDIFGRKRLYMAGVAGFTAASALCGLAASPEMLVGARVLQGALAGLMVPQVLSIIQSGFPPSERGQPSAPSARCSAWATSPDR